MNLRDVPETFVFVVFIVMAAAPSAAQATDRLPRILAATNRDTGHAVLRDWTIRDIVEVRQITDVAISDDSRHVAFLVKQSFIDSNRIRYGLYITDIRKPGFATKLTETAYLADLASHPHSNRWTMRADFGDGVQLYDVNEKGERQVLINAAETALDGGYEGITSLDAPRETGVFSYQWSPDGSSFWYSRPRMRSAAVRQELAARGQFYSDQTMQSLSFTNDALTALEGQELHVMNVKSSADKMLVFAPSTLADNSTFRLNSGTITWAADSRHIQYLSQQPAHDQFARDISLISVDVLTGETQPVASKGSPYELVSSKPTPDGKGYLTVREEGKERHLLSLRADGVVAKDYGAVAFRTILDAWWGADNRRFILNVRFAGRDGIASFAESGNASSPLSQVAENLDRCVFSKGLTVGACVRQSLTLPPELVAFSPDGDTIKTLVRPNAQYDEIATLRSEHHEWTNRFGHVNDGYITYPRHYASNQRYPVICVTHGNAARNTFVDEQIQWEYPIQVLAELGYLVLSTNEPRPTTEMEEAEIARMMGGTQVDVNKMQFAVGFDAVAGMEAALKSVVEVGTGDPDKTAIAGFSRGSQVVNLVMTQSKMFKVGSSGEGGYLNAGAYWEWGAAGIRAQYRTLFGGSPYDPDALKNYRAFSPSFRAREFAGPLLQQAAAEAAGSSLELYELLQDFGIPTELVFYRHEAHVFYQPRHRVSAMKLNIDWFDYWLLGKRNSDPSMKDRYERWDAMARVWKKPSNEGQEGHP